MLQQQEQQDAVLEDAELLFVDEDFPADRSMLTLDAPPDAEWRRPHELCDEPQLFVDGACRYDVVQGALGNCWSMAVCAAMAERPELVRRVVPDGQILHGPGYSGCIVIRLWHMNHWRDVEIDDRLPVQHDEPLYGRSSCKNEFWMSLVEKAFAKFHGGYENLNSGQLTEGFINLTGYSVRSIEFSEEEFKDGSKSKNEFFKHLRKEIDNRSLIACARAGEFERGLPGFHGYTVTGAHHVRRVRQRLVRVRNPWGDDEWTGKWRDDHDIWKELGADVLEELDYKVHVDGEFWMKFSDFLKMFQEVCIGSRQPSIHEDKYLPATEEKVIREFWTEDTAGGPFGTDSFYCNPQILFDAVALRTEVASPEVDSAEDDAEAEAVEAEAGAGPVHGGRSLREGGRSGAGGAPAGPQPPPEQGPAHHRLPRLQGGGGGSGGGSGRGRAPVAPAASGGVRAGGADGQRGGLQRSPRFLPPAALRALRGGATHGRARRAPPLPPARLRPQRAPTSAPAAGPGPGTEPGPGPGTGPRPGADPSSGTDPTLGQVPSSDPSKSLGTDAKAHNQTQPQDQK